MPSEYAIGRTDSHSHAAQLKYHDYHSCSPCSSHLCTDTEMCPQPHPDMWLHSHMENSHKLPNPLQFKGISVVLTRINSFLWSLQGCFHNKAGVNSPEVSLSITLSKSSCCKTSSSKAASLSSTSEHSSSFTCDEQCVFHFLKENNKIHTHWTQRTFWMQLVWLGKTQQSSLSPKPWVHQFHPAIPGLSFHSQSLMQLCSAMAEEPNKGSKQRASCASMHSKMILYSASLSGWLCWERSMWHVMRTKCVKIRSLQSVNHLIFSHELKTFFTWSHIPFMNLSFWPFPMECAVRFPMTVAYEFGNLSPSMIE